MTHDVRSNIARRTGTRRLEVMTAIFAGLLCVFVWLAPENPYWLTAIRQHFEEQRRAQAIGQMMTKLRNDPPPGTPLLLPSEKDVLNRSIPKATCWVLVVNALSTCTVSPLREWQTFAQRRKAPFIVITTSSVPVARLFMREHRFGDFYFLSDPLIAQRPGWNVFMYPRLYLLDSRRRVLWVCQMPMAHPKLVPDHVGGDTR